MSTVKRFYTGSWSRSLYRGAVLIGWMILAGCGGSRGAAPSPEPAPPPLVSAVDAEPSSAIKPADFEAQVAEYIEGFPYQETYNYIVKYTNGDPGKINTWVIGETPALVEAGQDKMVRMNNDTLYKMAFVMPGGAPTVVSSTAPTSDRFYSFQLMDDRNVNFKNIHRPRGRYALYRGTAPEGFDGELIEVPSDFAVVIVRVEVKNKDQKKDVAKAQKVFEGITIGGPAVDQIPRVDRLSAFDDQVAEEATRRIMETAENTPLMALVPRIGQTLGKDISYLNLAAGTLLRWGSPDPHHSAYEIIHQDTDGQDLVGDQGPYTITTAAPPAKAFWSVTVYDTDRGGYFHPNPNNRYHINNSTAKKNKDKTVTFLFKTSCEKKDKNCLAVPPGRWDITARYYEPEDAIINGEWQMPRPARIEAASAEQ
jgi:hypothetical protein